MSSVEKSEILMSVGKKIKELREAKGLSQVDLVGEIEGNIDTTNISRIESGRTNPTLVSPPFIQQFKTKQIMHFFSI